MRITENPKKEGIDILCTFLLLFMNTEKIISPKLIVDLYFFGFSILVLDLCSTKYSDDVENEDFSIKSVCPTASEFLHNRKNRRGNIASPVFSIPSFVLCSTKYSDENERRNFC